LTSGGAAFAGKSGIHWPESDSSLEVALIYEDAQTRRWTQRVTDSVVRTLGKQLVHSAGWKLGAFTQTTALAEAVATTSGADVIIIALYAADECLGSSTFGSMHGFRAVSK
jgi:hypothetical protein